MAFLARGMTSFHPFAHRVVIDVAGFNSGSIGISANSLAWLPTPSHTIETRRPPCFEGTRGSIMVALLMQIFRRKRKHNERNFHTIHRVRRR